MAEENKKPNCYECVHRGTVPGDAHSCCRHPEVGSKSDIMNGMIAMVSGENTKISQKLGVTGNPHGIKNGWFMWPFNFDPVWLQSCNGFKLKENSEGES